MSTHGVRIDCFWAVDKYTDGRKEFIDKYVKVEYVEAAHTGYPSGGSGCDRARSFYGMFPIEETGAGVSTGHIFSKVSIEQK